MASKRQPSRSKQPSIKSRCFPVEVASSGLADFSWGVEADTPSTSDEVTDRHSDSKPSNHMLSTTKILSAVGDVWDFINQSSIFHSKSSTKHHEVCQKENILCYSNEIDKDEPAHISSEYFSVDLKSVKSNLEHLKVTQKKALFEPLHGHLKSSSLWAGSSKVPVEFFRTGLANIGVSCELGRIHGFVSQNSVYNWKYLFHLAQIQCRGSVKSRTSHITAIGTSDCASTHCSHVTEAKDIFCGGTVKLVQNKDQSVDSLYADYSLKPQAVYEDEATLLRTPSSNNLYSDYHIKFLTQKDCLFGDHQLSRESNRGIVEAFEEVAGFPDNNIHESCRCKDLMHKNEPPIMFCSSVHDKVDNPFTKHRHALAGALAGTCVSLCLHPLDTVKTVIQARSMDQKHFGQIFASVMSERGVTGLYRGIASNIASSAPISALYTFTYESVKGVLLPTLPKEYHSLIHCTAGGCASIATSFIFTPSEHIKQQMQVGSHYQNCWGALVEILKKGGLPSLYSGWCAVLCRNIPHSVIKFYTYESLKEMMSSAQPNLHPISLQTLVCGGIAGSTAAFFTTPFDVVKTKLQTQIPGSLRRYDGVLHALDEITKHEGLKGLYRMEKGFGLRTGMCSATMKSDLDSLICVIQGSHNTWMEFEKYNKYHDLLCILLCN